MRSLRQEQCPQPSPVADTTDRLTDHVLPMVAAHVDVGEEVDQLTQHGLVELWARIVLGQNVLQDLDVGLFDGLHRVVDMLKALVWSGC